MNQLGMKHEIRTEDSWREALESYLAWLRAGASPPSTMYLRSYHLRRFARDIGRPPFSLALTDLIEYIGDHAEGGWSPSTARSMRTSLRHFYEWAEYVGEGANIAAKMPKIKVAIGKPRPAPDDAVKRGERAHDHRVRLMVQLAAYAGLRCCEIAVIHTRDIVEDLVGWSLVVHGKGGKVRLVPLRDELAHLLRQIAEGYVFPGNDNGHLSAAYVSKLMSRALPGAVTAHMLRHWFATKTYRASGKDLLAVQQLLGHASVATTQIYTAIEDDALRRAVNF